TQDELSALRREGIANRQLLDFVPVSFSRELVPASALKLTSGTPGSMGIYSRSPRSYYTWSERVPAVFALKLTAGIIYQTNGRAKIDLFPAAETEGNSVAHAEVAPSRETQTVELKSTFTGLHRIEIAGGGAAQATWDDGMPMSVESSVESP